MPKFSPLQIVGAVVLVIAVIAVVGFVQDPFGWRKAREEHLEQQVDTATSNSEARRLETGGERESARRAERAAHDAQAAAVATATLAEAARTAPDADEPMDTDTLSRLRAHDRELCRIDALAGCPAAPGNGTRPSEPVQPLHAP